MSPGLGKRVGDELYLHHSAVALHPDEQLRVLAQSTLAAIPPSGHPAPNVLNVNQRLGRASWLAYPDFENDPFPALAVSWSFHCDSLAPPTLRIYSEGINPPILHRKELLVPPEHPQHADWAAPTAAAESLGLFDDISTIGFRLNWGQRIAAKGYQLKRGTFVPLGNDDSAASGRTDDLDAPGPVRRHLTALSRTGLSAPVHLLIPHGLLNPSTPLFDYGCGKGDGLASLQAVGYTAAGWNPHYAPDRPRHEAQVVNLGFVLNVIEDPAERVDALANAFRLTTGVLAVAGMLRAGQPGRPWGDGVMTTRGIFLI